MDQNKPDAWDEAAEGKVHGWRAHGSKENVHGCKGDMAVRRRYMSVRRRYMPVRRRYMVVGGWQ